MTVTQLIADLEQYDGERKVIVQKDAEGNGHSPLCGIRPANYEPDSTWSGRVGPPEMTAALRAAGYVEEDICSEGSRAIILCPVN